MDWGGTNSRFLGLVSVWAARSFDQTALRPSVIKRIRQIDVKYITHITSFGVTAWTRVTAWTCMCELPRCTVHWTRISIHWILDFKQLLLLLLLLFILIQDMVIKHEYLCNMQLLVSPYLEERFQITHAYFKCKGHNLFKFKFDNYLIISVSWSRRLFEPRMINNIHNPK